MKRIVRRNLSELSTKRAASTGLVLMLAVLAMPITLVGCAYSDDSDEFSGSGDTTQPDPSEVDQDPAVPPVEDLWSCDYVPTFNNNWHDDILCSRGQEQVRPNLLPDQTFVTEDEILAAGEDYESKLNANG